MGLNKFHYVIHFFIWNYQRCCSRIVYFFWTPASIADAAAVIPNGAKTSFAKGITIFINEPANWLNNYPKNPPDWIILEIWALESF